MLEFRSDIRLTLKQLLSASTCSFRMQEAQVAGKKQIILKFVSASAGLRTGPHPRPLAWGPTPARCQRSLRRADVVSDDG